MNGHPPERLPTNEHSENRKKDEPKYLSSPNCEHHFELNSLSASKRHAGRGSGQQ